MPKVTVDADIDVWCAECGAGICHLADGGDGSITVQPCEACLSKATSDAYDEGYAQGEQDERDRHE